jgi:aminodeoxyfutalosine synthase
MIHKSFSLLSNHSSLSKSLKDVAEKIFNLQRISPEEAILLYEKGEMGFLGLLANFIREYKNGDKTYFNRNFHIEPTNVCVFTCKFCSYSRLYKNREEGWELTKEQILERVKAYDGKPVTEVHIVGGVHPKMDLGYFCDVLKSVKEHRPELHIKAFTAVELHYMFHKAKVNAAEGLKRLKESGLGSLPGGGAEIFDAAVRNEIAGDKCTADQWLDIHRQAHLLGIHSNATMLYGHIENFSHRVDHMNRLRDLQDETNGFNTFIPLKFRNKNNDMSGVPESTMVEDMRNYAVARIFLDNFPHIKAYWPMIGRNSAQLSLSFGVDDVDGTIDDSTKIYTMAGSEEQHPALSTSQLVELIRTAGRLPVERDTLYNTVKTFGLEDAPAAG